MTAERKTLDGMVIVPRKVSTKKTRRPVYGWTQHRTDCVYASRIKYGQQAPITPYPNTVNCKTCLPEGDHRYEYAELPDGTWIGTCSACDDLKVTSASKAGARHKLSRSHQAQRIVESEESP